VTRKPWIVLALTTGLLIFLAWLAYISRQPIESFRGLTAWIRGNVEEWILYTTAFTILVQFVDKVLLVYEARKKTVQRLLDEIVKDMLGNDPVTHRCTLFVAVLGWPAAFHCAARLPWQDDKWPIIVQIIKLLFTPHRRYLYAYVRASKSNSNRSCILWPVYQNNRLEECEGMAGQVWKDGALAKTVNIELKRADRKIGKGVKSLDALAATHPLRRYSEETNMTQLQHATSRATLANHYVGQDVRTRSGERWGVLLIDSTAATFPAAGGNDPQFRAKLRTYAQILSALLT
jgi:hypothetical protein